jgi:hypothetical protein
MAKDDDDTDLESEIQRRLAGFAENLPPSIDVAAIGVLDKAPYKALAVREALIWRTEELGRGAYEAIERGDLAAGILLTRGVVECAALMGRLAQVVAERANITHDDLHEILSRMLLGWKSKDPEYPDFPEAINVLTLLKHLDKRFGPVTRSYEQLSEFAHPNWGGVTQLFSRTDQEQFITYFGRFEERTHAPRRQAIIALAASLAIFEHDYNHLAHTLAAWLPELEKL